MRRINPWLIAAFAVLAILAVAVVLANRGSTGAAKPTKIEVADARKAAAEKRCASARTYEAMRLELFRTAAETRGADRAAFDRISAASAVRMEQPILTAYDIELGTTRCSGRLSLDLPPGLAVVGGRGTLSADIDYVIQPAADGSGDVVMLEGDAPITLPLATLAQIGGDTRLARYDFPPIAVAPSEAVPMPPPIEAAPQPIPRPANPVSSAPPARTAERSPAPVRRAEARRPAPAKAVPAAAPAPVKGARARPSFNCRYAKTRGEKAICGSGSLASLDRQMASQYYRAVASTDARRRQRLAASRNAFLRRRDRCSTEACIAASYDQRMREIAEISGR